MCLCFLPTVHCDGDTFIPQYRINVTRFKVTKKLTMQSDKWQVASRKTFLQIMKMRFVFKAITQVYRLKQQAPHRHRSQCQSFDYTHKHYAKVQRTTKEKTTLLKRKIFYCNLLQLFFLLILFVANK